MLRRLRICAPVGLSLLLLPAIAYALDGKIDGKSVPEWQVAVDTVWTIVAGILVFLMQAGFAMVEGGFTRAKNVANIMMKNIGDFSMASLGFWILGFGIMFGNGNSFLGTTGFFVAAGTGDLYSSLSWTSVPTLTAWFFQLVFCATAATIVSGAMAERTRFSAYLIFSFIISLIFYPMVGHWIWGGGWLAELGMLDFAGSTVVHSTGAWFALAGVIVLVWCLTNTVMKMRGHFGCRQGAMTSRGDLRSPQGGHHARKSNAADGQKDPQIHKRICETPH